MRRIIMGIFFLFCVLVIIILYLEFSLSDDRRTLVSLDRCVDGDTAWFILDHKSVKVRFLGIDTPEISGDKASLNGESAKDYTCNKLKNATSIYLQFDQNSDRYDKYDRMLAWVFVDDVNLSELLVSKGYAMVKYIYGDYLYVDRLCSVQEKAYRKKLLIWKEKESEYSLNYCNKKK